MGKAVRISLLVFLIAGIYAVLRYHIFKGVGFSNFPMYVMNKILSLSGFTLLVFSLCSERFFRSAENDWPGPRRFFGRTGFAMIILHLIMSLVLLRPEVYSQFFTEEGNLNARGEWSMFFGTLGILAYILILNSNSSSASEIKLPGSQYFQSRIRTYGFGFLAILLALAHIVIMGVAGWLEPAEWPGRMPPITMIAALVFLAGLIFFKPTNTNQNGQQSQASR